MTYPEAVERLVQALTDEYPMTDESGPYRSYVESEAQDMLSDALADFQPMEYGDWLADGREAERVERVVD